jgi:hypothetical protein
MRFQAFANMRIAVRLGVSFLLVVMLAAALGGFAIRSVGSVAGLTRDLYEHPYAVTKGLLEARVALQTMQRAMLDAAMAESAAERDHHVAETDAQYAAARPASWRMCGPTGPRSGWPHGMTDC